MIVKLRKLFSSLAPAHRIKEHEYLGHREKEHKCHYIPNFGKARKPEHTSDQAPQIFNVEAGFVVDDQGKRERGERVGFISLCYAGLDEVGKRRGVEW